MQEGQWPAFEAKMRKEGLSQAAIDAFKHNYQQLVQGVTGMVRGCSRDVPETLDQPVLWHAGSHDPPVRMRYIP
jgi:hypothetical protein